MLETPLFGRFQRESTRLVFSAPLPYHALVRGAGGIGAFMIVYGLGAPALGTELPFFPEWWLMVGTLLILASIVAALSLQSIAFDLRERVYTRRQGPGIFPRVTKGSIGELDAIVLIAEPNARMLAGGVTYHLVLHWKAQAHPSMVLQQDTRAIPPGQPLNIAANRLLTLGASYAKALNLKFFDNSHFASKCPVAIWD